MNVLSLVTNKHANFYQEQVRSLENQGINIKTIAPQPQPAKREIRVQTSRTVPNYLIFYLQMLKNKNSEFDIIHANNGLMAPFALAQRLRPVVLSFWGSDLMENHTTLCQKAARYANAVILPSKAMTSYLDTDYTVIPFGVDTGLFSPMSQSKAREEVGWNQDKTIVLFPYSKSRSVKNYPLAKQIVKEIEGLELRQISGVAHKDVPLYMNASDCLLVTSKRESGPMVVKEAALCNVPVVSTDVGFVSEVLSDVENSYVCNSKRELKDRLKTVIELGDRSDGRKHSDEWSIDRMGERLVDVYETVLIK
jgi:glycosyltransferase involved in cell wall biosynthesis